MDVGGPRGDFNIRTGNSIYGPGVYDCGTAPPCIKGLHFPELGIKFVSIYEPVGNWTLDYEQATTFSWVKTPVSIYEPGGRILTSRHRMRLTIILVVALAASSCASRQRASSASSGVAGPALAQQLAETYLAHLPSQRISSDREALRQDFTRMFFTGFTDPGASLNGSDAAERGFEAGQKFRRHCNAQKIKQTMEAYGYVATEATGTWNVRFEVSSFRPRNAPDETWWLNGFGNTKYILSRNDKWTSQPILYRVSGFLSPIGGYGHLGGYIHEFYATKVVYIKDGG